MESTQIRRTIAFLTDVLIVGLLIGIVNTLLLTTLKVKTFELLDLKLTFRFNFSAILYVCYFVLFDLINDGITIGKSLMKIQVVDLDGFQLSKTLHLRRTMIKIVAILILPVSALLFMFRDYFTIQDHYSQTKTVQK